MADIVDTHALVWYLEGGDKLGPNARNMLNRTSERLIIPTIVLCEAKYIAERGRTQIRFEQLLNFVSYDHRFIIHPIDENVAQAMPVELNIHDGIICGTALLYQRFFGEETSIITKDEAIKNWGVIPTIW